MCKRIKIVFSVVLFFTFGAQAQHTLVKTSDDALFRKGLELFDKEKYGAAREAFSQYSTVQPYVLKTIDAEYYMANCALNLFHADGEELILDFITKYPNHTKTIYAYYDLGSLYYSTKKYDKAIEYLSKVEFDKLSLKQKNEAQFKLGYSYFTKKEFDRSVVYFNPLKTSVNKYTFAASYYAGYSELKSGMHAEALTDLSRAESNEEYKSLVPHMICGIYYRQGKYDDVISYGEKAVLNNDVQVKAEINLMIADAWYAKKEYLKAIEKFEYYLKDEKTVASRELAYRIGYAQFKTSKYDAAVESFKKIAVQSDTLGQSAAFYLGLSYLNLGNKEFALTALNQARKLDYNLKTKEEALFYYGKVNVDLLRFHDAIQPLKEFVTSYPQSTHSSEAGELLSESFLNTRNYAEAISYIDGLKIRSIRINKAYQKLTYYRGTEFFNEGKYDLANELFVKSMLFSFDRYLYAASAYWKAEIFSINKMYLEAINAYAHVFESTGDDDDEFHLKSRYGIGYAYYNSKLYDKSLVHFKAYITKLSTATDKLFYTDALIRVADLYYVDKKYEEAVKYYDLAIKNSANDIDYAYYQKGVVLVYQDKLAEANLSFQTVILNYPKSVYLEDAIYQKAQVDFRNNNLDEAIVGFSKLINSKLNNQPYEAVSLLKRAVIYTNINKYEEARLDYLTLLDKYYSDPIHEDAIRGAQQVYALLDKTEEFNQILEDFNKKNPESSVLEAVSFESAKSHYFEGKYKKAAPLFEAFLIKYTQSGNVPDGKYFLAESYYQINDIDNATIRFKEVISDKNSGYVTKAIQKLADINFKAKNYGASKEYYLAYFVNSKNKKEQNNAMTGLMETYFMLNQYDSVDYYANEVLKNGNLNINAESKANMYIGRAAYLKGDYDKATDYFLNLINFNNESLSAEAQYYIAEIQFKQKKYKQSIESLYYLNNNFYSDGFWLGKSFLLISENLIQLKEFFQAKSTLNSIIENSKNTEIVEQAKKRLIEIELIGKEEEVK